MKDIDFDELDRAVNSLMDGVPKSEPAKQEEVTTVALDSSDSKSEPIRPVVPSPAPISPPDPISPPVSPPVVETPPANEAQTSAPAAMPAVTAAPAARRGRFMDVVRPSAADAKKPVPSRAVSRHGAMIEPISQPAAPVTPSVDGITAPEQPPQAQPDTSSSSDWPDPLASVEFDKTTEAVEVKAAQAGSIDMSNQGTTARPQMESLVSGSPFLPDAKVEKRPLGRPADSEAVSRLVAEPDTTSEITPSVSPEQDVSEELSANELSDDKGVPPQPLPVELGQEVMAIEADTSSFPAEQPASPVEAKMAAAPAPTPPAAGTARPVSTSIPQQYKVHPQVSEPSSGAIYDTATYHQPLAHPAKKKPGWLWVAAIILILFLGAASGAAVYFFGLV